MEIYRDQNYLVLQHTPMIHPTTIVAFTFRNDAYHPIEQRDFNRRFLPDTVKDWGISANFISCIPSRNCWYLGDHIEEAMAALKAAVKGTRVLAYGSSMGAYAAINWSRELSADFFALSPLFTIFDPFMSSIADNRFEIDRSLLPQTHDTIIRGHQRDSHGVIVYDDNHPVDKKHAAAILRNTKANAITMPNFGHPTSTVLNRIYPLKKILADIVENSLDIAQIQNLVNAAKASRVLYDEARYPKIARFLAKIRSAPEAITPEEWIDHCKLLEYRVTEMQMPFALSAIGEVARALQTNPALLATPMKRRWCIVGLCRAYQKVGAMAEMREFAIINLRDKSFLKIVLDE